MGAGRSRSNGKPPVRLKRKRSLLRKMWPVIKKTTILVVALLIGTLLVNKILRPFRLCDIEGREKQRLQSQYVALKNENADLRRRKKYLGTQKGIVESARKLGYVKPGEISLVIPDDGSSAKSDR